MDVRIFFEYNGKIMQLPVTPPEITVQRAGKNDKTEVVKLGEIKIIRDTALAALAISSFFPATAVNPAVNTKGEFSAPDEYIQFFEKIRVDKKPCFMVITGLELAMKVSIDNFEWGIEGGDNDVQYSLSLGEFKDYVIRPVVSAANKTQPVATATNETARESTSEGICIGQTVLVNGQLCRDSRGNGPGQSEAGTTRRITLIRKEDPCPYLVATLDGLWRGWVGAESVKPV